MISYSPIGYIHSDFKEKFGVPKQSQMNELESTLIINKDIPFEAFKCIDQMSHVWVIFHFHINSEKAKAMVRPPLLGGNQKVGVFSSRSSFRFNNIGLSLTKLVSIDSEKRTITLGGLDCVDGTPILDLKPYHPVADIPKGEVHCGWIERTLKTKEYRVEFKIPIANILREKITSFLRNNPAPSFHEAGSRVYGVAFANYNIQFQFADDDKIVVIKVEEK